MLSRAGIIELQIEINTQNTCTCPSETDQNAEATIGRWLVGACGGGDGGGGCLGRGSLRLFSSVFQLQQQYAPI